MTEEIFYIKKGRKYVPISVYSSNLMSGLPIGSHLVTVKENMTSYRRCVEPATAEVLAAAHLMRQVMLQAMTIKAEIQPPHVKFTPKQKAAWEAFAATMKNQHSICTFESISTVIEAGMQVLEAAATEKRLVDLSAKDKKVLRSKIMAEMKEHNEKALMFDGFDEAYIGPATRCGQPTLAAYSYTKCIEILMRDNKMSHEGAVEYYEFNTVDAWVGENTPIIIHDTKS